LFEVEASSDDRALTMEVLHVFVVAVISGAEDLMSVSSLKG
jgi:hypothetical protein